MTDHANDHEPVAHSDPEAASALSEEIRQRILALHGEDPDLTSEQISQTVDAEFEEEVTLGAVNAVLLAAAFEKSVE